MFREMNPSVEKPAARFDHKLCESSVTCTERIEDMGLLINSILHFHIMWVIY